MATIRSLKPNVTRAEAERQLRGGVWQRLRRGPLRAMAEIYLPYQLYEVAIENRGVTEKRCMALESFSGTLDLYGFEQPPGESEMVEVETRNCPPALVNEARGSEIVADNTRRLLFTQGFFRLRNLKITARPLGVEVHVPYWAGFYGDRERLQVVAVDAVRRQVEGGKASRLIEDWLLERGAAGTRREIYAVQQQ